MQLQLIDGSLQPVRAVGVLSLVVDLFKTGQHFGPACVGHSGQRIGQPDALIKNDDAKTGIEVQLADEPADCIGHQEVRVVGFHAAGVVQQQHNVAGDATMPTR